MSASVRAVVGAGTRGMVADPDISVVAFSHDRPRLLGPLLVILDEAPGYLDAQTESEIQAGLERFLASRTALVVAGGLYPAL